MGTYFDLCSAAGDIVPACSSCQRNPTRHPQAAADPHQARIAPVTNGPVCRTWLAIPATPRIDTGD